VAADLLEKWRLKAIKMSKQMKAPLLMWKPLCV